jgi:hypothetical protein
MGNFILQWWSAINRYIPLGRRILADAGHHSLRIRGVEHVIGLILFKFKYIKVNLIF